MEQFAKEEIEEAKKTVEFYTDLVENNSSTAKYYFGENIVLDWFGKTVKTNKKVSQFLKEQVGKISHHLTNTTPSENVAFKDTHKIKIPKTQEVIEVSPQSPTGKEMFTPPKQIQPSTSTIEIGQGDGIHNQAITPPKKPKLESSDEENNEIVEGEAEPLQLKYLTAEGSIEFHRPSNKKLQTETRWSRPIKLHLGYVAGSFKDYTIYLIIYEGNLKCRRNLLKSFCESESSANGSV